MADTGSTSASFTDKVSPEILSNVAKYLNPNDLKNMRTVNSKWNKTSKAAMHKNGRNVDYVFRTVQNLIDFNEIFASSADETLSLATFWFLIPVMSSKDALPHLTTFGEKFGRFVTKLVLNFAIKAETEADFNRRALPSEMKPTVESSVKLLLSKVKCHLVELRLDSYLALCPSVLGVGDFSSLRVVSVIPTPGTDGACILALSKKLPAIQKFVYLPYFFLDSDSPDYLANVLRNTIEANDNVEIYLGIYLAKGDQGWRKECAIEFIDKLAELPPRIYDLTLLVAVPGERCILEKTLNWIASQTHCLKRLTFLDVWMSSTTEEQRLRSGLKLPSLAVLDELMYFQLSETTLINYQNANYFPQLRKVTTFFSGDDFTTPLPNVTDVWIIVMTSITGSGCYAKGEGQAGFERRLVSAFPNVRHFKCDDALLQCPAVFKLRSITHFTVLPSLFGERCESFWDDMTQKTPRLTLQQIMDLPAVAQPEIKRDRNRNVIQTFKDLTNLVELKFLIRTTEGANWKLSTLLYLSKTKQLQRLKTLVFELTAFNIKLEEACINELKNYHDCVVVTP